MHCEKKFLPKGGSLYCSKECSHITKKCIECGGEFKIRRSQNTNAKFCSQKCRGAHKTNNEEEVLKRHYSFCEKMFNIFKGRIVPLEIYKRSDENLTCLCLKCNNKTTRARADSFYKHGCSYCDNKNGKSIGEEIIKDYLDKHNINYIEEYKFSDLAKKNNLRYDFAILDNSNRIQTLIEFDGIQHFQPIKQFGGVEAYIKQKEYDKTKTEYAKNNNLQLVRINHKEINNINNILERTIGPIG